MRTMPISETGRVSVDLEEAARQLQQAAHDAQVAYDSLSLGNLDWAHTSAIIARAEADAAETFLRAALRASQDGADEPVTAVHP
jgi:regulator of protease activity HflC (stomatin/prohibitin superfamily)